MYRLNTKIRLTMLCLSGFLLYSRWVPLLKQQRRRLRKLHLKSEFASNLNRRLFQLIQFVKFWSCVLKHCIKVQEKRKKVVVLCSRETVNFQVEVVQRRQKKVQKSVMDVQSCCFSNLNTLFFAILVAVAVVVAEAPHEQLSTAVL